MNPEKESFMIYGFDAKIKFVVFLRAIAKPLGIYEGLSLTHAKTIADAVGNGRPLRIWVGDPSQLPVYENYAKAIGCHLHALDMDFHAEARGEHKSLDNDDWDYSSPDWDN